MSMTSADVDVASPEVAAFPRSVLVAEDELLLARTLTELLQGLDMKVIGPAPTGVAAIDLAREHRPDLAIMDIRMPEMDGLAAGEVIYRELDIPVVILTAYSDQDYVDQGCRLGVFGYLLKPVNLDELRVGVSVAWRQYHQRRSLAGQVADLEKKLRDRKVIERAKGLVMKHLSIGEEEAMRRLQKQARDSRKPMAELAQAIIDADGLVNFRGKA
jgi:AmiR/NasT family two-component response regulator